MTPRARRYVRRRWAAYARWLLSETARRQLSEHKPAVDIIAEVVTC